MHVVWKRPDGFHDADPADFMVVTLANRSKLWLHKRDHSWFPFRVAGGWQESESTKRLNNLVYLLSQNESAWVDALLKAFNDSMGDDPARFIDDTIRWVSDLRHHLKGDTWELDIMDQAISEIGERLSHVRATFLERTSA